MSASRWIVWMAAAVLQIAASTSGAAQTGTSQEGDQLPRFLRSPTGGSHEPLVINPAAEPLLNRRIAINLQLVSRAAAIQEIALTAGVRFVYADDVLPNTATLQFQRDNITVAAALTEVLRGAGVDVVLGASGNIILIRKPPPPEPADSVRDAVAPTGVTLAPVVTTAQAESRKTFEMASTLGHVTLGVKDLAAAPAPFERDLLRTLQLLPGVESKNDYSAGLNVRGGESDQNLILLDGYPIYNPFHLSGLLGTFIDPLVGKVDLLTGAQPVKYGERLSSVLDVQSAEDGRRGVHGTVDVSLLSATASVGNAFESGGSWMIGGRHTYADVIANIIKPNSLPYGFSDIQGHLTRPIGNGGTVLSITGYSGADGTSINDNSSGLNVAWGNHVIGATLSRTIPAVREVLGFIRADSVSLMQRASLTTFDATAAMASSGFDLNSSVRDVRASGSVTLFSGAVDHSAGYEIASEHVVYSMRSPLSSITNFLLEGSFDQSLTPVSAWYDALWHASPRFIVDGGVRVDAVGGTGWAGASPRVSVKYFLTKNVALVAAAGSYAQWLHSLVQEDAPAQPLEFWVASSNAVPVSRAFQGSVGAEMWTNPTRQFRAEAFYKKYSNLIETNPGVDASAGDNPFTELTGTSYGVDVLLRQIDTGRFSGWIAYSYAVSTRVTPAGVVFNPGQDRRHELNAVGAWSLARYRLSARLGMSTGTPYTPIVGQFTRERYSPLGNGYAPDTGDNETQYLPGPVNSARFPFEERIDVSIMRVGRGPGMQVSPYLSIANLTAASNPAFYVYEFANTNVVNGVSVPAPQRTAIGNLPFLPTIGVHIVY